VSSYCSLALSGGSKGIHSLDQFRKEISFRATSSCDDFILSLYHSLLAFSFDERLDFDFFEGF
jgi:hypothetical protein